MLCGVQVGGVPGWLEKGVLGRHVEPVWLEGPLLLGGLLVLWSVGRRRTPVTGPGLSAEEQEALDRLGRAGDE